MAQLAVTQLAVVRRAGYPTGRIRAALDPPRPRPHAGLTGPTGPGYTRAPLLSNYCDPLPLHHAGEILDCSPLLFRFHAYRALPTLTGALDRIRLF